MKLFQPYFSLTIILVAILFAGCSHLPKIESDKVDYESAGETSPLEVPPDLVPPATDDRYSIPSRHRRVGPYVVLVKGTNGITVLTIDDPFDRAWYRIGLVLDQGAMKVTDRNREKGIYQVRYTEGTPKPGFFSRLFNKKKVPDQYQILVTETPPKGCRVSVLDKDGKPDSSVAATNLLTKIYDKLK